MFKIVRVQNWRHIQEIADNLVLWGFRGQGDASWKLDTTIHRTARTFGHPFQYLWHGEYWMLRQFQRRAHHYCQDVPEFDQKLNWLALMQHYGAPTRLLDFSHSLYVAAYFALENATKDSAIWAIDLNALRYMIAQYCGYDTHHENIDTVNRRHINFVNEHISLDGNETESGVNIIVHVEPERLHERLLIQQGIFLFPCNISISFEEVLSAMFNFSIDEINKESEILWDSKKINWLKMSNYPLIKFILPKEIRAEGIKSLYKMNISAATLFPGLDGFARSMKYHLSIWPIKPS